MLCQNCEGFSYVKIWNHFLFAEVIFCKWHKHMIMTLVLKPTVALSWFCTSPCKGWASWSCQQQKGSWKDQWPVNSTRCMKLRGDCQLQKRGSVLCARLIFPMVLMLKLKLQYFGHLMRRADSLEKTLMLGKIEGDDRGRDGWMVSPTQWTWVWVDSGSWWWTGRPGVQGFMGSQRVGHNWATELNWMVLILSWEPCGGYHTLVYITTEHWGKNIRQRLSNLPVCSPRKYWIQLHGPFYFPCGIIDRKLPANAGDTGRSH